MAPRGSESLLCKARQPRCSWLSLEQEQRRWLPDIANFRVVPDMEELSVKASQQNWEDAGWERAEASKNLRELP